MGDSLTRLEDESAFLHIGLHALKGGPKPVKRDAGALHLFPVDCTVRSEIDTARACLEAGARFFLDKSAEFGCIGAAIGQIERLRAKFPTRAAR